MGIRNTVISATAGPSGAPLARRDSWQNLVSGFGVNGKDARLASRPVLEVVDQATAETLWRGNDMAARIVETHPYEMTREGWELHSEDSDGSALEDVAAKLDDLGVQAKIYEALTYARAYGGGALLLGADDGQRDVTRPLQPERVRSFDWINVLLPQELTPFRWYSDPMAPRYGEPEIYTLTPSVAGDGLAGAGSRLVHESRVIRFNGTIVSKQHQQANAGGWGDSCFNRVLPVLRDFGGAWDGAGAVASNFAQSVMKMKGLADLLASEDPEDANRFRARVAAVMYSQSLINVTMLDGEGEDFERKTTNLTGLPDLLDKFAVRLSAAAEIPVIKLMEISANGLNPSGAADLRFFYDGMKAKQESQLRRPLNGLVELVATALGIKLPENWVVRFRPLWQMTDQERATYRKTVLEGTQIAVNTQMITPQEAATSHFGGDQFAEDIKLSTEDRDALAEEQREAEMEIEAEKAKAAGAAGEDPEPGA